MNLDGFDFEGNLNLDEINKEANKNKFPEKIYQDLDECYKDNTTGLFYCSSKQNKDVVYVISERFYQIHTRGSNKVDSEQFLPLSEEEFNKFKKQEEFLMCNLKSKVILNLEINDLELVSELNRISLELNISQDKLIESAIKKLINDIEYVRQLKN